MSTPQKKSLHPRGKQHDARAASFKRIAKALRYRSKAAYTEARHLHRNGLDPDGATKQAIKASIYTIIAHELDTEVATLRVMR